jgi:uncharacterized protein (DUF1778 family)
MVDLRQNGDVAFPVRCAILHEAQLAILSETAISLAREAVDHFIAVINAPVSPMPDKLADRLSRKALWDDPSA